MEVRIYFILFLSRGWTCLSLKKSFYVGFLLSFELFFFFPPIRWPAWAMFNLGIEKVKAPSLDGWNSFVIRKNPHAHLNNRGNFAYPDICLKYTTC